MINIDSLPLEQFTNKQYISNIKIQKNDLSTSDIRLLSKEIGDFRNSSPEHILKCILLFSFWQPDKAIEVSRKKGVFRYKAWGVKNNVALYLLQNIKKYSSVIEYSDKTLNFIDNKINISWLFDFYKKAESKIVAYIKKHHSTRLITKIDGVYVEEALFKELLAFKRFFVVMNIIAEELLFKQKNKKKIVYSLIPGFNYDSLKKLLSKFVGNATKAEELLQMFTYKKSFKLDLQYTPFLKVGESYFTSISLAARSNLIRNCIAYSYLSGNQIVNKDDKEWLVQKCNTVFKVNHPEYEVFINSNFNYNKQHGEIDALVVGENDLFIIECKCPLLPTNNFELRSSYDHLLKASKQLDLSKAALMDKAFRNNYLKGLGVIEKGRNIHTCIIMGNRLFNGYSMNNHPIRYIHELDMLLNRGLIDSEVGSWRVWENKNFSNSDLLTFLSPNYKLAQANFASMEDTEEFMFIDGKKIYFKTYRYNILKAFKGYDECFAIESRDEKLFEDLLQCTSLE